MECNKSSYDGHGDQHFYDVPHEKVKYITNRTLYPMKVVMSSSQYITSPFELNDFPHIDKPFTHESNSYIIQIDDNPWWSHSQYSNARFFEEDHIAKYLKKIKIKDVIFGALHCEMVVMLAPQIITSC